MLGRADLPIELFNVIVIVAGRVDVKLFIERVNQRDRAALDRNDHIKIIRNRRPIRAVDQMNHVGRPIADHGIVALAGVIAHCLIGAAQFDQVVALAALERNFGAVAHERVITQAADEHRARADVGVIDDCVVALVALDGHIGLRRVKYIVADRAEKLSNVNVIVPRRERLVAGGNVDVEPVSIFHRQGFFADLDQQVAVAPNGRIRARGDVDCIPAVVTDDGIVAVARAVLDG